MSERNPNRLIHETSPYLLQHAYNPVDWYPWGEEAFAAAAEQDKPVFLSVGYSACHWCHVMEHESFEDDQIAELMNQWFINIKVDREERPDVDQIYMSAVQLMTQRGGWPMSVFLTPDKRPFYGGTYWPPSARMGMPGFVDILKKIHEIWTERRDDVASSAASLTEAVGRVSAQQWDAAALDDDVLRKAMQALLRSADRTHGGFGGAPKFPHPMDLRVLLRCWRRFDNHDALEVATHTLDHMARGGIYDHLGGGFHRYSTDARWLVPHFEKMLYDNALLVPVYLELGQAMRQRSTGFQPVRKEDGDGGTHGLEIRATDERLWPFTVVRQTLDYVLREMQQPEGGFYSTQDADSEGEEGKFFVWSEAEIDELLPAEDAKAFKYCYDVTAGGNWEGKTILNRPKPHEQAARVLKVDPQELDERLARCRQILFDAREQRVKPGRDDKILVAWNGWMISAMAQASQVLGKQSYAEAATRAAEFITQKMRDDQGRLLHSYKDGRARFDAYLDDYAGLIEGLCDLYQATFEVRHLETARNLADDMLARFADADHGGFFYTADDHEQLIARTKDAQDNATPSGNAQAATALLKLGRLTGNTELLEHAHRTLQSLSGILAEHPRAAGQGLLGLDALLGPTREIVLVDGAESQQTDEWIAALHDRFLPNKVLLRRTVDMQDGELPAPVTALLSDRPPIDGQTTAYICQDTVCGPPVTSLDELLQALEAD
jgi:uncharacterized protein